MVGFEPAAYDGGSYRSVLHYFPLQHRKLSAVFDFGQTLFAFMTEATSSAMGSIIESAPLVKKIRINKMIFPVEKSYVCAGKLHSDGVVLSNRGEGFLERFPDRLARFQGECASLHRPGLDVASYESGSIVRREAPFVNAAWPLAVWIPPLSA